MARTRSRTRTRPGVEVTPAPEQAAASAAPADGGPDGEASAAPEDPAPTEPGARPGSPVAKDKGEPGEAVGEAEPAGEGAPASGPSATDPDRVATPAGEVAASETAQGAVASETGAGEGAPAGVEGPSAPPPARRHRAPMAVAVIALIVALLAIAASVWLGYRMEFQTRLETAQATSQVDAVDRQLASLRDDIGQIKALQQGLQQQLGEQQTRVADQQGRVAEQQGRLAEALPRLRDEIGSLSESVAKVYQDLDRSLDSWALEEVEQLLLLANHRVQLAGDVDVAIAALGLADGRLRDMGDPSLTGIRGHIAEELTRLQSVERVDLPTIALRISALAAGLDGLPLKTEPRLLDSPAPAGAAPSGAGVGAGAWVEQLRIAWYDVLSLVRVRRSDAPKAPLLPVEQRFFLVENVRLMLQTAQLALLRERADVYRDSLERAAHWVEQHYDISRQSVVTTVTSLRELAVQPVSPELPRITESLAELRELKRARNGR